MSYFQKTVLKKHIASLDAEALSQAYHKFTSHFQTPEKQANIRASKEEQYQEGFLRDLFVDVFGYTLNPEPNYDLTTEFKNQTGAKKADGAVLKDGQAIAVIELKGMNTTDLGKIEAQAFGYKNNQPQCRYVITANFQKLRFYIDNAVEFIEFDLFTLSEDDFATLYTVLQRDSLFTDTPKKLKDSSISQEEVVTKQLYKDYALFKRELFADLTKNNPDIDGLVLFKKSQKLLDRLLFIFFAEDSGLLPANFAREIITEWDKLKDLNAEQPLYQRFKQYFDYLNTGHKSRTTDIFAYNGGLFYPDEILDTVTISDAVIEPHTKKLADYDFASEVDVNILGHIFENSLSEIDEFKAELAGQTLDKSQTKRQTDGVFYTPKYITKYIVEQTVGKLCTDKKAELGVVDEDYLSNKRRQKKTLTALADKLKNYRDWLLQITICDPACGSGAFLNEALNFLIAEHAYCDELEAKLHGDSLVFKEVENHILENNLFGVDINEESVEIAKLSLWLRTAKPKRKLNTLSNNIKCGNSLIDDPDIAGDKAFDWAREFPQVFGNAEGAVPPPSGGRLGGEPTTAERNTVEQGESLPHPNPPPLGEGTRGFDVVIGNPPYGVNFDEKTKKFLSNFDNSVPDFEIYIYFISLYKKILKVDGILSYIFPNTFLSTYFGEAYRKQLLSETSFLQIVDLSNDDTFHDASVRTVILSFQYNQKTDGCELYKLFNKEFLYHDSYKREELIEKSTNLLSLFSQSRNEKHIFDKIKEQALLNDFFIVSQGYIPYRRSDLIKVFGDELGNQIVDDRLWHSPEKLNDDWKREILGKDVRRYNYEPTGGFIKYGKQVASYVNPKFFEKERILVREITSEYLYCALVKEELYNNPSLINVINEKEILGLSYALTILNSKLIGWYHNKNSPKAKKGLFPKILINDVRQIPLPKVPRNEQQPFIDKADQMLTLNSDLQAVSAKFLRMLARQFDIDAPSKKLQNWHELDDKVFFAELEKARKAAHKAQNGSYAGFKKLSLGEMADWEDYFFAEKAKADALTAQIQTTDREIDQMVYELYDLTDEEIAIVESA